MISHRHRFIFIHLTKTAGSSIEKVLGGRKKGVEIHYDRLPEALCRRYYLFTFVRNPWDRVVSHYYYTYLRFQRKLGLEAPYSFAYFVRHMDAIYRRVIASGRHDEKEWVHVLPQVDLNFHPDRFRYLDFIGRFERLQRDFDRVCDDIGIERRILPHTRRRPRPHYTTFYDDALCALVADRYRRDIETFGYRFGED